MISIVLPAYNEEKIITQCLDSLINQKTSFHYEVIVVNNNSTDKTAEIAKSYKNKLNLRIVNQEIKGRGSARQKGFQEAKGDIILSTDADTILPFNWVEKLITTLQQNNAIAVTGTCKIVNCDRFTNVVFNLLQPICMRLYRLIIGHFWLSGFNFAIYKTYYDKSGGFKINLNAQEDIELSYRVSKLGKIKFISDFPVTFSGRRFREGLIKGTLPYILTFIKYFFYKQENIILPDVR